MRKISLKNILKKTFKKNTSKKKIKKVVKKKTTKIKKVLSKKDSKIKTFKTKNNKRRTCYMCSKANTQGICIECAATEAGSASKRCAQFGPTKDRKKADEHILAHRERAMGIERPLSDRALANMYNEKLPGSRGIWQGATGPQAAQAQVETAQM